MLLPSGLARLLDIFAEPVTIAKATERLWMLDTASAHRAFDQLIRRAAIRRVAGDAPADENNDRRNGRVLIPEVRQPVFDAVAR